MDITVVLPVYERADAALCALSGLAGQTYQGPWEIVIVDDSPDTLLASEVTSHIPRFKEWATWNHGNLVDLLFMRSSPPRVGSFTAGRARNIGVANARGDLIVFVDQDVILHPEALDHYSKAWGYHSRDPDLIIAGLYHWLPPVQFTWGDLAPGDVAAFEILARYLDPAYEGPPFPWPRTPVKGAAGLQGHDIRTKDFSDSLDAVKEDAALGSWTGNIAYPRELFYSLGGFDEAIAGHGGEDADLGLTAKAAGANWLLYSPIWGLHRWHGRDQEKNAKEVQENIAYIDKKHGIGEYAGAEKFGGMDAQDWRDWRHYQKDVGGVLMQETGDGTVYVCRDGHRLGLPSPDWIRRLGFLQPNIMEVSQGGLSHYIVEGVAGHD